jgi:hypothetical protein
LTCKVRSEDGTSYRRRLSLATTAIEIDEWSVITVRLHAADGILPVTVENGDGAVKGGAAYTNWRGWALPQPNVIRIIGATVGTTSFLAVVSRRSWAAFITAYT